MNPAIPGAVAGLALAGAVALGTARRAFRRQIDGEVDRLLRGAAEEVGPAQLRARWSDLPEPARRYFSFAVRDGAPPLRTARLEHEGTFRTKPEGSWLPIVGRQHFSAARPGFVWDASVAMMPGLHVRARDALLDGGGSMLVKVASIVTVADACGAEIDQGATVRWLAETPWFPFALAGRGVRWEGVDASRARVSLLGSALPVAAIFEFDPEGRIVRLEAERYRDLGGGRSALDPWSGTYGEYRELGGFHIPTSVEVAWDLPEGRFAYARFRVTSLEYNV